MNAKIILIIISLFATITITFGKQYKFSSPNNEVLMVVNTENAVSYSLFMNDTPVLNNCKIGLELLHKNGLQILAGENAKVIDVKETSVKAVQNPVVAIKSNSIVDNYNELCLVFKGNYSISFRLYDNGMAYRFETNLKDDIKVSNEIVEYNFPTNTSCYFTEEKSLISHYEQFFSNIKLNQLADTQFCSLPLYLSTPENIKAVITEADLDDYSGLFLQADGKGKLSSLFPKVITKLEENKRAPDRNEIIIEEANYIASTKGTRTFPWRVVMLGKNDADIFDNQLVYLLSSDNKIKDPSWIKPGKVSWDWWNANNIYGVDFESGINNETYKYYIDFASEFGLEYIILDEGWSKSTTNVIEYKDGINVEELVAYGKEKNVGVILWLLWKPLDKDLENILKTYHEWGVKGIKVDFMQRADQYMVNYYTRVAQTAAKYELLVDFHGAFKPSGLRKAYPNVLTYEGVKGLENDKWGDKITPEHDVTLPFTRMTAGPMDYTPGAMDNAMGLNFADRFYRPMSQGTRAHQVAMYVIYESPLQMLADNPSNYYRNETCTRFISEIPVTWDETRVLKAEIGNYIVVARKKDDTWYIGAMGDEDAYDFELDLSFIGDEYKQIKSLKDGINAHKVAIDHKIDETPFTGKLNIHLAPGGGYAAIIKKQ